MKYFTKEMWIGLQNDARADYYENMWKKNSELYLTQLKRLKSKLSKKAFYFFSDFHRQGEYVLSISIINDGKVYYQKETKEYHIKESKNPIDLSVKMLCPTGSVRTLKYTNVRKYTIDFPSAKPLWFNSDRGHGSWGYDELSLQDNGFFCHEILLDSGATLKIEFKEFTFLSKKYSK